MNEGAKLVLENQLGQTSRTMLWKGYSVFVVFRHDTRRIEVLSDLSELEEQEIEFTILKEATQDQLLNSKGVQIPKIGKLRLTNDWEVYAPEYELPEEDSQQTPFALKWSLLSHVFILLVMMGLTALIKPAEKQPESVVVMVPPPTPVEKEVRKLVKVSETKIEKVKVTKFMKVVNHSVPKVKPKPIFNKVVRHSKNHKTPKSQHTVYSEKTQPTVENIGALGALGGLKNGTRGYQGLDINSMKNIRSAGVGNGGGGVGPGIGGGIRSVLPGNGLIAGSQGSGGRAEGAGGYGTRGVGGGKAGYGKLNLVGSTAGITMPVDEEALVQGGLDKDQIAAVINKNMGQIVYCYEQGLQAKPSLKGRVSIKFVINPKGRISLASVANTSLNSAKVEGCIVTHMKSWKFPEPVGAVSVNVLYPFDLRRVSQN